MSTDELHTLYATVEHVEVPVRIGTVAELEPFARRLTAGGVEGVEVRAGLDDGWPPQVHVSAQQIWHDDVTVTVDARGAAVLAVAARTAASLAAAAADPVAVDATCADGEGYRIVIRVADPDDDSTDALGVPVWRDTYADPIAGGPDWVRDDPQVTRVLDAFDALGLEGRAGLDERLVETLDALRSRCRGPLLSADDPRAADDDSP